MRMVKLASQQNAPNAPSLVKLHETFFTLAWSKILGFGRFVCDSYPFFWVHGWIISNQFHVVLNPIS
jgi:hypothetical protein